MPKKIDTQQQTITQMAHRAPASTRVELKTTVDVAAGVEGSCPNERCSSQTAPEQTRRLDAARHGLPGHLMPMMTETQQQTITQMAHLVPASRKMIETQQHATRQMVPAWMRACDCVCEPC